MEQILILRKDVPEYLHPTALYSALSSDDDSPIAIPASQYKKDDRLESVNDLCALVSTLHFWGPFEIPDKLIEFVLQSNLTGDIYCLHDSFPEFTFLKTLANVNFATDDDKMSECIKSNNVQVLRVLSHHKPFPLDSYSIAAAAGSLDCIQYMRDICPPITAWDVHTTHAAVENGHSNCLQYLHDNGCDWVAIDLLQTAAGNGHENCLQYMFEKGAHWIENVCTAAATNGSVQCLALAFAKRPAHIDASKLVKAINLAAVAAGNVSCVMLPCGTVLDVGLSRAAAKNGQLISLHFLCEHRCPWDETVCTAAARNGHLDCLQYLRESGCPWRQRDVCRAAARGGHIACLRYSYHLRFRDDISLCRGAAASGVVECLKFLRDEGKCRWDSEVCAVAAKYGRFECLQYARENGCPWDRRVCINAVRGGHLSCLVYAHEHGCLVDPFVASQAAGCGSLECLQYLHEQGCGWEMDACVRAAAGGHLECLKYLLMNRCLFRRWKVAHVATEHGHLECADFVNSFKSHY